MTHTHDPDVRTSQSGLRNPVPNPCPRPPTPFNINAGGEEVGENEQGHDFGVILHLPLLCEHYRVSHSFSFSVWILRMIRNRAMFTAKGGPASVTRRCLVPGMNSLRRALNSRNDGAAEQWRAGLRNDF